MVYLVTDSNKKSKYKKCTIEDSIKLLKSSNILQIDIETSGFDPHTDYIISVQIGDEFGNNQIVIDAKYIDITKFKGIIENSICLFHNAKFDLKFLYKHGIHPNKIIDTFIRECVLTTGISKRSLGLDAIAYKYNGLVIDKSLRANIYKEGLTDRVIQYGADDVKYLNKIAIKQHQRIVNENLERVTRLEEEYVKVLAYTEYCGFKLDREKWIENDINNKKLLNNHKRKLDSLIEEYSINEFISVAGDLFPEDKIVDINWNSSKQVIKLMQIIGIDTKITVHGKVKNSVNYSNLKKYEDEHPIVKEYLIYSKIHKQVSTYGKKFLKHLNKNTNRLHSDYWQILNTARISSSNPNLQNITADEKVRSCFVADKDNTLVVLDYSQQETRVLADQANDRNYINFFLNGDGDSHSMVASRMFSNIRNEKVVVSKEINSDLRTIGKVLSFQIAYGASPWSIKNVFNISEKRAANLVKSYLDSFPDLSKYFIKRKKEILSKGYLITDSVSLRRIYMSEFDELNRLKGDLRYSREYYKLKGKFERVAMNYPIQSISASMVKLAGIRIFKWIIDNNLFNIVKIVSFIHDEICIECPKHMAKEVAEVCKQAMESSAKVFVKAIPIPAIPNITDYWKK